MPNHCDVRFAAAGGRNWRQQRHTPVARSASSFLKRVTHTHTHTHVTPSHPSCPPPPYTTTHSAGHPPYFPTVLLHLTVHLRRPPLFTLIPPTQRLDTLLSYGTLLSYLYLRTRAEYITITITMYLLPIQSQSALSRTKSARPGLPKLARLPPARLPRAPRTCWRARAQVVTFLLRPAGAPTATPEAPRAPQPEAHRACFGARPSRQSAGPVRNLDRGAQPPPLPALARRHRSHVPATETQRGERDARSYAIQCA